MRWAAFTNWIERLQVRNRKRLVEMLPHLFQLALLGTLLLGLYHVLRLEPSRKRITGA